MKRILVAAMLLVLGVQIAAPAFAARRVVVRHRGAYHRTTVVVHRGWPLRRPARVVYVRPARTVVRVAPVRYLAPVVFVGTVVAVSAAANRDVIVWEDAETFSRDEDWTEITLNADSRGRKLWFEVVNGRVQADWAEVVFENGDARVVDFKERTLSPGLYSLLDFADGRKVDHVRMVVRSKSDESRIALKMEK
jgi:hypothetical protein